MLSQKTFIFIMPYRIKNTEKSHQEMTQIIH
jgi:hypothetical protein